MQPPFQLEEGVFVRFIPHDDSENHRAVEGFRMGWIMMLGVPLDFQTIADLQGAVSTFGKFIHWHREDPMLARVMIYAAFPSIQLVPRDVVFGDYAHVGGGGQTVLDSSLLCVNC